MATIPRMFHRRTFAPVLAVLSGALAAVWLTLALLAGPADAQVNEVKTTGGPAKITVGLQPREAAYFWYGPGKSKGGAGPGAANPFAAKFENKSADEVVHGQPIVPSDPAAGGHANTYAIYWDPQDFYHGDWQGVIDGFLANAGAAGGQLANASAVDTQYTDKSNLPAASYSTFRSAYTDTSPYPEAGDCTDPHPLEFGIPLFMGSEIKFCLTATQIETELKRFIKQRQTEGVPLPQGMSTIYYLLTPPGVTVCLNEGGAAEGRCSDFTGKPIEISRYEEKLNREPEKLAIYAAEEKEYTKKHEAYVKALSKYTAEKKTYEENKAKAAEKEEQFLEAEPVGPPEPPKEPIKPKPPTPPAGLGSYTRSFCSYHGAIATGAAAILYGMIPWTAGGYGDGHLSLADESDAFACQNGGYVPGQGAEEKQREPPETTSEEENFNKQPGAAEQSFKVTTNSSTTLTKVTKAKAEKLVVGQEVTGIGIPAATTIVEVIAAEEEVIISKPATKSEEPTLTFKALAAETQAEVEARQLPILEEKEQGVLKAFPQEPSQIGLGPDGSYDHGLADLIINQIAVEQQNIITDPLLNAWQDNAPEHHNEVTDECRNFFVPTQAGAASAEEGTKAGTLSNEALNGKPYYLNLGYNLAGTSRKHQGTEFPGLPYPGIPCPNGVALEPLFTAPNTVKGSEVVGFDGMESNITLASGTLFNELAVAVPNYATYTWNFGDETPEVSGYAPGAPACETPWLSPCAASEFHSYTYNGTYTVTLRVKDVGGNEARFSAPVTVVEGQERPKPPPAPPQEQSPITPSSGPSGSGSSGSGSSGSGSSSSGTTGASAKPAPVATAAVASTSLKSVLAKGLSVRYSVNEQVTGHFEVLLAASVAKKIGLHGTFATGLPKGTPAQIVIGKAILVTTQGGHNSVKILFGKKTAKLLRKLHKVSLMVRLIVHNGLSSSATSTTTVNSLVTLTH